MRPIPQRFQEAISKAKAEGARTLSLRGDGKKDGDNVLFEVPEAVFSLEGLEVWKGLEELDLSSNEISTLPDSISKPTILTNLRLYNNPLETPPLVIVEKGISAIQAFFRDRQKEGIPLHEARILIVGEPGQARRR